MRISEAETIRIASVNLTERVIVTGLVNGHRKSGKVYFFIPQHLAVDIKNYLYLVAIHVSRGDSSIYLLYMLSTTIFMEVRIECQRKNGYT